MLSRIRILVTGLIVVAGLCALGYAMVSLNGSGNGTSAAASPKSYVMRLQTTLASSKKEAIVIMLSPYALWLLIYPFLREDVETLKSLQRWARSLWGIFALLGVILMIPHKLGPLSTMLTGISGGFAFTELWIRRRVTQLEKVDSSDGWSPAAR